MVISTGRQGGRRQLAEFHRRAIGVALLPPSEKRHMLEDELRGDALRAIRDGAPHARVLAGVVCAHTDDLDDEQ